MTHPLRLLPLVSLALCATGCPSDGPPPTPDDTATPSPTPTATVTQTATATAMVTATPTPTASATPTQGPTPTQGLTPTQGPTPTPGATPTLAETSTPSQSPTLPLGTDTPTATPQETATPTESPTPAPTASATPTPAPPPTATPTSPPTPTPQACDGRPASLESLCEGACPGTFLLDDTLDLDFRPSGATWVDDTLLITDYDSALIKAYGPPSVTRWEAPNSSPTGLAFRQEGDTGALYIGSFTQASVAKVNVEDGESIGSISTPADNIRDIAIQGDTLWLIQEERLEVVAVDLGGQEEPRVINLPIGEPAGVEFCRGFGLISDRNTDDIYIFDAAQGRLLGSYDLGDINDAYGLSCDDTDLYVVNLEGLSIHKMTLPIRNVDLNPAETLGDMDLAEALGWDACAPAKSFDLSGDPGRSFRTQIKAEGGALGVAITAQDGKVLFSAEGEAGEVIIPPDVTVSDGQRYTLWVVAMGDTPDFDIWATQDDPETMTISGRVLDDVTDAPIPGALVQVADMVYGISAVADEAGAYTLTIPEDETPDFVVVTASGPEHFPATRQIDTQGPDLTINFYLEPLSEDIVLVGAGDMPIHLGNGTFSGTINSQFQSPLYGPEIEYTFTLTAEQAARETASLSLFMKGAQNFANLILVNDVPIEAPTSSPADGSYEELVMPLWTPLLREGTNTLKVIAGSDGSDDIDDFEFSTILIRFSDLQAYDALGQWQLPVGFEPSGLAWEGDALYVSDYNARKLYTFDPSTGATELVTTLSSKATGLAGTGDGSLWMSLVDSNTIENLTLPDFEGLQSIDEPVDFIRDIDLHRGMLWVSDRDLNQAIALSLADGSQEEAYTLDIGEMAGLEFLEENLWVVDRENTELVIFERLDSPPVLVLRAYLEDPYAMTSQGGTMWITDFNSGRILAFAGSAL